MPYITKLENNTSLSVESVAIVRVMTGGQLYASKERDLLESCIVFKPTVFTQPRHLVFIKVE